jgi:hypothetical protein
LLSVHIHFLLSVFQHLLSVTDLYVQLCSIKIMDENCNMGTDHSLCSSSACPIFLLYKRKQGRQMMSMGSGTSYAHHSTSDYITYLLWPGTHCTDQGSYLDAHSLNNNIG